MLDVMIVDDMEFIRREIKKLKLWGELSGFLIAEEAVNGLDALRKLESRPVDLVITDIRMPVKNGIELLQKVTEKKLAKCVVLFSEHCEFAYARQGLVFGAFDYITKPIDEKEFEKLLQRAKQFIMEKKYEEERVRKLEEKLGGEVELFCSEKDVKYVIELIQLASMKAVDAALDMAEAFLKAPENDTAKTEIVLRKSITEIISATMETYPWINKFIDTSGMICFSFSKQCEPGDIRAAVADPVNKIITVINSLMLDKGNSLVKQVCLYVLENIDSGVSLKVLSEKLFVSSTHLSETFKHKTGISLVEYLTKVKLERAKKLIEEGELKIYEIANRLGYEDINYFNKLFKRYTGLTPVEFKQLDV